MIASPSWAAFRHNSRRQTFQNDFDLQENVQLDSVHLNL